MSQARRVRTLVRVVRMMVLAIAGVVFLGCGSPAPPRHVVLLTVDTWRADHAVSSRAGVELTPRLAEFSERSVRFVNASSVANATSPGVAGFLTGVYPTRSGVITNDHVLDPGVPTLATLLSKNGFVTAGFVANPVVGPGYGFEQGFDTYELLPRPPGYRSPKAEAVNRAGMDWLESLDPDQSAFLWLHYMEPHGPYQPLDRCAEPFTIDGFGDFVEVDTLPEGKNSGRGGVPAYQYAGFDPIPTDGRDYLLRYAAEVRCVDDGIGAMLDHLAGIGWLEDAVIAITADHAEALLDDHGFFFSHANGLTEDQIAVPLWIRVPGIEAGSTDRRTASTVDVVPTILTALGLGVPEHVDGSDLMGPDRPPVFSFKKGVSTVRDGRWKMIQRRRGRQVKLFDLETDPAESRNLADTETEVARTLGRHLRQLSERDVLAKPADRRKLDKETREALRALGYLTD